MAAQGGRIVSMKIGSAFNNANILNQFILEYRLHNVCVCVCVTYLQGQQFSNEEGT